MKPQSSHPISLILVLAAFLAGVLCTALILSRTAARPAREPDTEAGHHAESHAAGEAGGLIRLEPQALRTAGIRVETLQPAPLPASLEVPGSVEVSPNRSARITPPVAGKVARLLVNPGDCVRAGQPLVVLDSFELAQAHADVRQAEASRHQAEAAIQTAQAEVAQSRAGIALAQAELQQARARLAGAEAALQRQRELAQAGAFGQAPLQAAQAEMSDAQAELLQAQTELQSHAAVVQRAERLFREELIARSELEQAQLEHQQDKARVEKAQARVAIARRALEREQTVFQSDLHARQAVQSAEAEARAAQGEVQKAQQGVRRAQQETRKAEKEEQAARTAWRGAGQALSAARSTLYALEGSGHTAGNGGLFTLHAPLSGVITEKHATPGEAVERSTVLFVIENLQTVTVQADVPEGEVARVRPGQPVEVTVAAYPGRRYRGVVQTLAGRVEARTRTLAVRCLVENRDGKLKPEMFTRVALRTGTGAPALSVPVSALEEEGDRQFVYVAKEEGFERREVVVDRAASDRAAIRSGLAAGERVVTEGVFVLKSEAKKDELKGHED